MGQVADDFFEKLRKSRIKLLIIISLKKKERKDKTLFDWQNIKRGSIKPAAVSFEKL